MNTKRTIRQQLMLGTIIGGSVLAIAGAALAQDAPAATADQDDATDIGEVVVTGSRIRRDPTTAPTPLIQVDREDLLNTGQATIIDYLATIPALSNSLVPSDTTGGLNNGGLALPNLRSLGTGRTLTLVDGRRHVGSQGGTLAVDVDTIPRLLIQNVEIITGGASSVYGADAVSGVLNFILRKDFEGLEVDANYGMINQDGQANMRFSALAGANLLDDRLNIYAFAEFEQLDEIRGADIDWLRESRALATIDADTTAQPSDGQIDVDLFRNVRTMQRLRWGVVNLANNQPGSVLSDPDIPYNSCGAVGAAPTTANYTNTNCTALNPGHTWVLEGPTARLADFGTRIGVGGVQRVLNIGGDGEPASEYGQYSFVPGSESYRFQTGMNFAVTDSINARAEIKHVSEDTFLETQPTFYDIFISDRLGAGTLSTIRSTSAFDIRLSDNAFMPANLKAAIQNNVINIYSQPTATSAGTLIGTAPAPYARSALRGQDRTQTNTRTLNRFVASLDGMHDQVLFARNVSWDVGYTYGEVDVINREQGTDVERMAFAADAIVDTAGVVNGRPGEVVCRAQVILANGGALPDAVRGGDVRSSPVGLRAIRECEPLNIFGKGNQSEEALAYIDAEIAPIQRNEQEQLLASVSGQLWDFWGAGSIGVALGAETRREFTQGIGRDRDTAGRFLFLNTGADFPAAEYESEEYFAELSLPLFRDNWLGEYAELSGSYRTFDYTTIGKGDVFGVNLVYRPIADIAFKTSFNSSLRAPDLGENFAPRSQTFANGFVDPCSTASITAAANAEWRTNRIANCQTLLNAFNAANGTSLSFDFAGATAVNTDDFGLLYGTGGIAGVSGGNPFLQPEESESFTFSTVIQPRAVPNLSVVLDYYEIELTNIIASVTAQIAANNCVNGPTLNTAACATIFRRNPTVPFGMGAPTGDPIGGFIQGSINYAKRTTRGLDFSARYQMDLEEMIGRDWGRIDYNLQGSWLIEQKQFNNASNANDYTQQDSTLFFPRVRLTSALTYTPNDVWSVTWTLDWQTAQDITPLRTLVQNNDSRPLQYTNSGNFSRHDFTVRYNIDDQLTLRGGVTNAFDNEQAAWLGSTLYSNFDPYGTRFFIGLNWRPY
jgi:outer membrane receptor protein involved in Fe transport